MTKETTERLCDTCGENILKCPHFERIVDKTEDGLTWRISERESKVLASELRKGYFYICQWIDEGMKEPASTKFTEGDCRLAAQLCEYLEAKRKTELVQSRQSPRVGFAEIPSRMPSSSSNFPLNFKFSVEDLQD